MMADLETMSYNHAWGGTIPFPEQKWKDWYDYWLKNHENKRYYRYLKNPLHAEKRSRMPVITEAISLATPSVEDI